MKANWIAGGLLLVPLSVVAHRHGSRRACWPPCCRPGVQVGQFSGSVWRGAAQPVYWHGGTAWNDWRGR